MHNSTKILLAHFHFCNKGSTPIASRASSLADNIKLADLDGDQAVFLRNTIEQAKLHSKCYPLAIAGSNLTWSTYVEFARLKDNPNPEMDMYFVSQLFDPEWLP